ncbi:MULTISPECIES: threonine--tRNA ligase [unclassified Minwuia]|jgi:threonyl-tRNA synthetase|uniref:threonine--tRNA ligase n=1 Tax=unclassified Minwuia TaxID=2618799 RepID=UPI00247964EC|nr:MULTISPECIES: threonine--tRNA ligase [unclassified Minwuia]
MTTQAQAAINVTLPDGNALTFERTPTGLDVAAAIGPGLAKAALAVKIDGELRDLKRPIEQDAQIEIVTAKSPDDVVLPLLRHDAAHVLAQAAQELFPDTQVTIGPSIENGFYYDFARDEPFTPEDVEAMEQRMHEIVDRDLPIERSVWARDDAIRHFRDQGEHYKAEIIEDLPEDEPISIYAQGDWMDLCIGPHLASTARLGHAFKLTKLAGAYWRGDSRNPMLQRVYGTCWRTDKELKAYLTMLEEAEKRDHRRLGREMSLFHMQEEAPGMAFWHPKGWTFYLALERYMRQRLDAAGYREVKTPQLVDRKLWEASGHWEKFREHMFTSDADERNYALKPMNCPGHVQIFRQGLKSYRDLPMRMAEFGCCHRYEPSGALHGLMRVRNFTQDDAHIFCAEDQINSESAIFCDLLTTIYRDFGFEDVRVKFSDRPPVRAGSDETWDKAEAALREAIEEVGLPYEMNPGEGAFYGPKLEFVLRDAIGRDWQCGTLQVDFVLPERLDASYIGEDGERHRPVMLHRAILGSFERFAGILIENFAGKFPLWLSPVQAMVATITQDADVYAAEVVAAAKKAGLRVESDLRNEKINYKVREHSLAKVPVMLVVGKNEAEQGTVSVRRLGDKRQQVLALEDALAILKEEAVMPGSMV